MHSCSSLKYLEWDFQDQISLFSKNLIKLYNLKLEKLMCINLKFSIRKFEFSRNEYKIKKGKGTF